MSQHITQIKNRKKAVSGVKKITNAMKLVSTKWLRIKFIATH